MYRSWFAFFFLLVPVWCAAERRPLLPKPQEIEYGNGQLLLRGVAIRYASVPAPEDRFTAGRLAAALSTVVGGPIPVRQGAAQGKAILLKRSGAVDALPVPGEHAGPDSREAYSLKVTAEGVEIEARSSAGLYYGAETLRQLIEADGGQPVLPFVQVRDWPAFAYRAVMMDMSHGALPTEEEVKRQIDAMAQWKGNQYYFYSESNIEMPGYPLLSPDARFSAEQIRRIVDYARERHVDVVPCVEFYGHIHALFRIERYADLSVVPYSGQFNTSDPRTMKVISDWVDELIRLFPSPYLHIGLDEPYELDKESQLAGISAGKIYSGQLTKVANLVSQRGKHVVFWADATNIFGPHPETLSALPPGITAVPWKNGYIQSYEAYLSPFAKLHVPAYASTSVLNYTQVAPDFNQTFAALDQFMADARKFKAMGLLVTLWTDDAQNLMRTALPGLAYAMAASWQSVPMVRTQFFSDYARWAYPAAVATEVAPALQELSDAETHLQNALGFNSMDKFWTDPFTAANLEISQTHREDFHHARLLAEDAEAHLRRALALKADPENLASLLLAARMVDYIGMKYLYAAQIAGIWKGLGQHPNPREVGFYSEVIGAGDHSLIADLLMGISDMEEAYRTEWLSEYTPHALRAALLKWDHEYEYWSGVQRQLSRVRSGLRKGGALPPLESLDPIPAAK